MLGALFSFELWTYIMCFCVLGTTSHRITCHSFIPPSSPGRGEWVWIFLIYRWGNQAQRSWVSGSTARSWCEVEVTVPIRHLALDFMLCASARCYFRLTATLSCQAANLSIGQSADSLKDGLSSPPPQTQQPFPFCVLWQCWENYLLNPDQLHSSSLTLTGHLHLSKDTSLRPYLQNEGGNLFLCKSLVKYNQTAYVRTLHSMPGTQWNSASACFLPFPFLNFWTSADISLQLTWIPPTYSQPKHPVCRSPRSEPILLHLSLEWVLFLSWGWSFWVYFFVITPLPSSFWQRQELIR